MPKDRPDPLEVPPYEVTLSDPAMDAILDALEYYMLDYVQPMVRDAKDDVALGDHSAAYVFLKTVHDDLAGRRDREA